MTTMSVFNRPSALGLLWGLAASLLMSTASCASDLLITTAKPDRLFVIDTATRTVRAEHEVEGTGGQIFTTVMSPDQRIAYLLVARMERIVGIDIRTGRQVFRADLSSPTESVKDFFAMTITPDGKELVAYELRTLLRPSEYVVEEPRFAVFRTDAGLAARPVRSFPAPRRVHMLLARPDGKSLYALGFDLYEYDLGTGRLIATRGIKNWKLPNHSQPDLLAFWPVTEPTGVFTSPITSDVGQGAHSVPMTALMSLDLKTGTLSYDDFESSSAAIFSTVLSPDKKHAFGVYSTLSSIDVDAHRLERRVNLDHTFYAINISSDGRQLFLGGTNCDVGFYDSATLEKLAVLKLPGCPDQVLSTIHVIRDR